MSLKDKEKWNAKYDSGTRVGGAGAQSGGWRDHADLLDGRGKALDIAMGEGRNTLFAASLGYEAWGVDISEIGISRAESLARENKLTIHTQVADLDDFKIDESTYDLIICFYFLDRRLFEGIRKGIETRRYPGIQNFQRWII